MIRAMAPGFTSLALLVISQATMDKLRKAVKRIMYLKFGFACRTDSGISTQYLVFREATL